ncbi:unnamed protein product [Lampetra planeri]
METTAGEVTAPETVGADATSPHQQPEDGWRKVSEQLDLLQVVVVQLMSLITASTVAGAQRTHCREVVEVSVGLSAGLTATITCAEGSTQPDAAISGGAGEARMESAILQETHGAQASGPVTVDGAWDLAGIKDVPAVAEPAAFVPPVLQPATPDDPVVGTPPKREQEAVPVDGPASWTRSKCLRFR